MCFVLCVILYSMLIGYFFIKMMCTLLNFDINDLNIFCSGINVYKFYKESAF